MNHPMSRPDQGHYEADWSDMEDDLPGGAAVQAPVDMAKAAQPRLASAAPSYFKPCGRCGGSGVVRPWGVCFGCNGAGGKMVKSSPEQRAKSAQARLAEKVARQLREAEARKAKYEAWKEENPAEAAWLAANANGFEFAASLNESLHKWGSLTMGQMAAVQRCIERDAERAKARAEAVANAPVVEGMSKIEEAFAVAKENGIKYPKLRLAKFKFSPAGPNSKNPGAVYVLDAERKDEMGKSVYLGKVMQGRLQLLRNAQEFEGQVLDVIRDPEAAAVAYGKQYGACSICGRELSNQASIDRGIGPICAGKFGW